MKVGETPKACERPPAQVVPRGLRVEARGVHNGLDSAETLNRILYRFSYCSLVCAMSSFT